MRLTGIEKNYGKKAVLKNLCLEIEPEQVTCVFGRSGAGKTTLLNVLAGMIEHDGELFGAPQSVGYVFQEDRLISHLTVVENLRFVGGRDEVIDEFLAKTSLRPLRDRKISTLSGGEKRRVSLLRAFCVDSDLVLLDEPFGALDAITKEEMIAFTASLLRQKKVAAVLVTHDVDEALSIADKVAVLADGKIVAELPLPAGEKPREYGKLAALREELLEILRKTTAKD